jgi:signal transduction histidine kinase/ActR/RegA family two-component response regulator
MTDDELEKLEKPEIIKFLHETEERFATSNALAAELVVELEDKNDQLEKAQQQMVINSKLASIGQLASGVAHEINNPLAVALMSIELIDFEKGASKDVEEHRERIFKSLIRIKGIVNGLRNYARHEEEDSEPIPVCAVIQDSLFLIKKMFQSMQIEIVFDKPESEYVILGNRGKFQQVIMNFLSNARDAMKESDQKLITIRVSESNHQCVLEIQDTGCGIAKENQEKIFDMFYTTKEVGEGTGMGLGICLSIVQSMKGKIDIDSELGKGTNFKMIFPIHESDVQVDRDTMRSLRKEKKLQGTILVVDDETDVRNNLKLVFNNFGLTVTLAKDGQAALEIMQDKSFDIVFTDIQMPRLDGKELIHKILEKNADQKIIVCTGSVRFVGTKVSEEIRQLSCDFLHKPVTTDTLYRSVSKALES